MLKESLESPEVKHGGTFIFPYFPEFFHCSNFRVLLLFTLHCNYLDPMFGGRTSGTSIQQSNSSPNSTRKMKGNVRRKKKECLNVSYRSLTQAIIRISETGNTSEHDKSLLDAANKRVIEELYDGNVHLMTTKQQKSSSSSPPHSDGIRSRGASLKNSEHSALTSVLVNQSEPTINETDISNALQHMTTYPMNSDDTSPAIDSNYNEAEIAELDVQFKNELFSVPKRPTINRTNRNRTITDIRKRSFKAED